MNEFVESEVTGQPQVVDLPPQAQSPLDAVLREGARRMLLQAIEAEVDDYVATNAGSIDDKGHRLVVRNGHGRERTILAPNGPLNVRAPRINDKRLDARGHRFRFTSKILPPYLRKTKNIEELVPWLYLKGISTGDFSEALQALLGPQVKGLSATTVVRLKERWGDEYREWSERDLSGEQYAYLWADGIYCNIRLDDERQCLLVIIAATKDGRKELLAVHDGFRESELSWTEVLEDLKRRGLKIAPKLATGDGALGFWAALRKVFPTTLEQRCWVHKTANVLDKLPKSMQGKAKKALHDIYMAETREAAHEAFNRFVRLYRAKFPAAVECLVKDREPLLAFYDFPAEHWIHVRTTNPIESTFATIRLRHRRTKGNGSRAASLLMVWKLATQAQTRWRRLNGSDLIVLLIKGKRFLDGALVDIEGLKKQVKEGNAA